MKNADFTGAKAGLQERWIAGQLIVIFLLSILLNFVAVFLSAACTATLLSPTGIKDYTIFPGLMVVVIIATTYFAIARQGLTASVGRILSIAVAVTATVLGAGIVAGTVAVASKGLCLRHIVSKLKTASETKRRESVAISSEIGKP